MVLGFCAAADLAPEEVGDTAADLLMARAAMAVAVRTGATPRTFGSMDISRARPRITAAGARINTNAAETLDQGARSCGHQRSKV